MQLATSKRDDMYIEADAMFSQHERATAAAAEKKNKSPSYLV